MTWELPANVNPPDTVCVQLNVPNDPAYLAAFWGAILDTTVGFNWANDAAHTAKLAAQRMRQMYLTAQLNNCPLPSASIAPGFFLEDCMNIKQDPANPCLLREVCPDGSLGCVIFDASLCKPNLAPGGGTTPPTSGICQAYDITFNTHVATLLPFVVNAGDTLQLTSATGAANDGSPNWYCPDGEYFSLGACLGGAHTVLGSPVPTKPYMSVIWQIAGVSYFASSTPFTVPGGVTNAPVYVTLNNASLTSVFGNERVQFTYCNNSAPPATPWCHHSNFSITPDSFTPPVIHDLGLCGTPTLSEGTWSTAGWATQSFQQLNCVDSAERMTIRQDLGALVQVNRYKLNGTLPAGLGSWTIGVVVSDHADFSAGNVTLINGSGSGTGPYGFDTGVGASNLVRYVQISISINTTGGSPGHGIALTAEISGTGTPPPIGSNC